jgi:hypothetical protein
LVDVELCGRIARHHTYLLAVRHYDLRMVAVHGDVPHESDDLAVKVGEVSQIIVIAL